MREQLANNATTTLASSTTSSATTISVASASAFPTGGNFRLICGTEIMLCTAVSGTTFTVVRGAESTTAASHTSGSTVSQILTVGGLLRNRQDDFHLAGGSQPPVGRLLDASGNTLTSSDFTITNTAGATVTDTAGTIMVNYPALSLGGLDLVTLLRPAPSTPYSIVTAMQSAFFSANSTGFWFGLALSDTSGKLVTHGLFCANTGGAELSTSKMNSGTSEDSDYTSRFLFCDGLYKWIKLTDDGTNLTFYCSHDGVNWNQTFQVSRTDYLSAGPTLVGLFATVDGTAPSDGSSANGVATFAHYSEG